MKELEERILKDGDVLGGEVLKVDNFLNHQIDPKLMQSMGAEFAKHYADKILKSSDLNYTIIRPGILLNEPGTGKVLAESNITNGNIPREDVARAILFALDEPHTYKKEFDLIAGDLAMPEAFQKI